MFKALPGRARGSFSSSLCPPRGVERTGILLMKRGRTDQTSPMTSAARPELSASLRPVQRPGGEAELAPCRELRVVIAEPDAASRSRFRSALEPAGIVGCAGAGDAGG